MMEKFGVACWYSILVMNLIRGYIILYNLLLKPQQHVNDIERRSHN